MVSKNETIEQSQKRTIKALATRAERAEAALNPSHTVASDAEQLVYGPRHEAYGTVLDNFGRTAALWNVIFAHKLKEEQQFVAEDIATAMRLLKEARLVQSPRHRDSLVDIVGYALTQEKAWNERDANAENL